MTEGPAGDRDPSPEVPPAAEEARVPSVRWAVLFLIGIFALFIVGGGVSQILLGDIASLLAAPVFFGILPTVVLLRRGGYDLSRTLSLRLPDEREVAGGLLLLLGGVPVAWFVAWGANFVFPVSPEALEELGETFTDEYGGLLRTLLAAALVPAVFEEMLFRGVFLSALRTRIPGVRAALASSLVFGILHIGPGAALRFFPTAWLGFLFGMVVVATGSLPLAVLLHFVNNAAIVVLARLPWGEEMASDPSAMPPLAALPFAIGLLVWGARLLGRRRGEASP